MKLQIKAFAEITGVSVRTLRWYDEIGLLKPACVDETSGYRFYDEASLARMRQILFYRELDFPLRTIRAMLDSPALDERQMLRQQKALLTLKKERLEKLIGLLEQKERGEDPMDFTAFDNSTFAQAAQEHEEEVLARWGSTEAYREYKEKAPAPQAADLLDNVMAEFAACLRSGHAPHSDEAAALVRKLQQCITDHFYTCTDPILAGLGEMYSADERFRANIDRHGEGTAAFITAAIRNTLR